MLAIDFDIDGEDKDEPAGGVNDSLNAKTKEDIQLTHSLISSQR